MSERHNGTVKWFDNRKGYGFIQREEGDDVFVHYRDIRGDGYRTLAEGQRVEFAIEQRDRGLAAQDVTVEDQDVAVEDQDVTVDDQNVAVEDQDVTVED
jgi:CspA family cold shock protein